MGLYAPTKIAATTPDGERWAPLVAVKMQALTDEQLLALKTASEIRLLPVAADVVNE